MKALFLLQCSASHQSLLLHNHTSTTFSCSLRPKIPKPVIIKTTRISAAIVPAARDRVIDFGKHKGKMLGTLPSSYLKWVSKNLRARDFEDWAKLADEVLSDPVYRDRIEWELAEKVLNGDVSSVAANPSRSDDAVSELLEISERFGWDNEDKVGWSNIDFGLLGTSKGGRIPRRSVSASGVVERELRLKREKVTVFDGEEAKGRERRRERRLRLKRDGLGLNRLTEKTMTKKLGFEGKSTENDDDDDEEMFARNEDRTVENRSPFPGRESLLKKVLNNRKRLS